MNYTCVLETSDSSRTRLAEFNIPVTFFIKGSLGYEEMTFTIAAATTQSTSFKVVGNYFVSDPALAQFKINMALKSLIGYKVFGSGFPTWPRDLPEFEVDTAGRYIFLYDSSQIPHQKKK